MAPEKTIDEILVVQLVLVTFLVFAFRIAMRTVAYANNSINFITPLTVNNVEDQEIIHSTGKAFPLEYHVDELA